MDIVICGAGEVGRHAAEVLGADSSHSITVIDRKPASLATIEAALDVRVLEGNGAHADVLREAGAATADVFLAATSSDEINLLAASVASGVGAERVIARVHHSAYFDQRGLDYASHLGVNYLVCPENTTAMAIAQTLRNPGAIAVERFARGRIEMQQLPVTRGAPAVGRVLSDIDLPSSVRVAVIERAGQARIPDAAAVVREDDVVTLVGDVTAFDKARRLFHTAHPRRKRVMIMGGTPMGVWLSRALQTRAFSVRLFETDRQRCDELAEKLSWVTILQADPTDPTVLEEEHVQEADAFVALTADDEHNLLGAAWAKSLGTDQAIAVLQRPTYRHLLKHVGIDRAFSPRVTAVNQIVELLRLAPVRHLASLAKGVADVYEVHVSRRDGPAVGRPLRELQLEDRLIVAAIQRGDRVFVPGADDALAGGDITVLIGAAGLERRLHRTFVA